MLLKEVFQGLFYSVTNVWYIVSCIGKN